MKRRILPLLLVLCLLWLTGCSFDDTSDEDLLQEIYGYYQSGKDKTDAPLTSFALPVLQGQGTGRRLVETLVAALRERGVRGLHLGADARNVGALAFYDRLGFVRAASPEGAQLFTLDL